ncbi:MAG: hypothetical protein HZA94_01870 [Candidatus Vogelbacteria bacterium]|nr:hypothetical protein [Candidatus Vogelbacteria bacterium]
MDNGKETTEQAYEFQSNGDSGSKLRLYTSAIDGIKRSGVEVSLSGFKLGKSLAVNRDKLRINKSSVGQTAKKGIDDSRNILTFLIKPKDIAEPPFSKQEFDDQIFNDLQGFFEKESNDQFTITTKTIDWIDQTTDCYTESGLAPVKEAIDREVIILANYDVVLFVVITEDAPGCGFNGFSYSGKVNFLGQKLFYSRTSMPTPQSADTDLKEWLIAHELSHNLELGHANSTNCAKQDSLLDQSCSNYNLPIA